VVVMVFMMGSVGYNIRGASERRWECIGVNREGGGGAQGGVLELARMISDKVAHQYASTLHIFSSFSFHLGEDVDTH
jgi:hypothetical protein